MQQSWGTEVKRSITEVGFLTFPHCSEAIAAASLSLQCQRTAKATQHGLWRKRDSSVPKEPSSTQQLPREDSLLSSHLAPSLVFNQAFSLETFAVLFCSVHHVQQVTFVVVFFGCF